MSDQSCKSLFDLYVRTGEHLVGLGKKRQAADAFALALYYATELENPQAQRFCRQRIVHCDSGHEAARVPTPPLIFAKLLMTFPSEAAEQALQDMSPHMPEPPLPSMASPRDPAEYRSMGVYVIEEREEPFGSVGSDWRGRGRRRRELDARDVLVGGGADAGEWSRPLVRQVGRTLGKSNRRSDARAFDL